MLGPALLLPLSLWVSNVGCNYEVEVRVHSYLNPTGRCAGCRTDNNTGPGCCDELLIRSSDQSCSLEEDTCDPTVDYCIRPLGETGEDCPEGQIVLSPSAFEETNNFTFFSFTPSFFGVENPLLIVAENTPWTGLQVFFQIGDAVLVNNGFSSTVLIDSVPIDIDIPVGASLPYPALYVGNAMIAQLNISFKVRCIRNYTGSDCLTLCPDSWSCDECGLTDFTGDFCQFNAENCNGAVCSGQNSVCIRRDEAYTCGCSPGYTGDDCESLVDQCINVTCSGNGVCQSMLDGPVCVCEAGFTGDWCEVDVDECEQSSTGCSGKGRCVDGVNSFLCECDDGYIGLHCERQGSSLWGRRNMYYILGGVAGGLVLLIVILAVVLMVSRLLFRKTRKPPIEAKENSYNFAEPIKKDSSQSAAPEKAALKTAQSAGGVT